MDQTDELTLWIADGWLRASDEEVEGLVVEDLWDQAKSGTPLADSLAALGSSERQAGDFGMEIAGALLAPLLVELLKEFWSAYVKKLAEKLGSKLADETTGGLKSLFLAALGKSGGDAAADLERRVRQLAHDKRIPQKEADRLLASLRSPRLAEELRRSKLAHGR
jgi:hypothetical protein